MCNLNGLPVELRQAIFQLACSDGGPTGCSLSRVSKTFYAECTRARFFSLAFSSLAQLEKFLRCVRTAHIPQDLGTRHLWLSLLDDDPSVEPRYAAASRADQTSTAMDLYLYEERLADMWERRDERLRDAVKELMGRISSTLRNFTFLQDVRTVSALPGEYPALEELTLWGNVTALFAAVDGEDEGMNGLEKNRGDDYLAMARVPKPKLAPRRYPSLKRLHAAPESYSVPLLLDELPTHAPALTHLRLSGVGEFHDILPEALAHVFPLVSHEAARPNSQASKPRLLHHLEHVIIQAISPDGESVYLGRREELWDDVILRLRQLAARSKEVHGIERFVILQEPPPWNFMHDKQGYQERQLWEEWTERAAGGVGCWVEQADEEMEDDAASPPS